MHALAEALGFPVFTKPATLGSSVGITKAHDHAELDGGMEEAFRYARKALVERAIEPIREIECAVLGNDDPVASVAGEIMPEGHEFYDYAAKYLDAEGARLTDPGRDLRRAARPGAVDVRPRVPRDRVRGDGPGGLLPARGRRALAERDQHDPGLHVDLDVPEAVGRERSPYAELVERLLELAVERDEVARTKDSNVRELL